MPAKENADREISPGVPYAEWLRKQDPKGVDETSASYDLMVPRWARIQTVLDGTDAMREAKETYLPKHQYEDQKSYDERLGTTTLDNWTLRTLETLVGKAFKEPPILKNMPDAITAILPDMDGAGTSLMAMAERWWREAVAKAVCHVLVDFTEPQARPDGLPRTLEDDRRDNVRPFWRLIHPEDVIFMQGETVRGKFRLTQVRIREDTLEPDGAWGEVLVERIRVLTIGAWALYKKVKDRRTRKFKWVLEDVGTMAMDRIPLVSYHTDKTGLNEGKPPIEDLAHLNVTHFQSTSDQRSILTTSRFAMLAVSGAPQQDAASGDKPLVVGPKKWLQLDNPDGRFYYVEHTGAAINSGRTDLQDLEARMSSYGAEFLKKQPGRASATGRALDSSESVSMLQTWVRSFRDSLAEAIRLTEEWMNITEAQTTVAFDVGNELDDLGNATELGELRAARERGDISRQAYLTELKRRHLLPEDYDIEADQAQIDVEPLPGSVLGLARFAGAASPPAKGSETKPTPSQSDKT